MVDDVVVQANKTLKHILDLKPLYRQHLQHTDNTNVTMLV